jgi:hypothetical protein
MGAEPFTVVILASTRCTPFFPPLDERIGLELAETRTFGGDVVYLRYRRRGG